MPHHLQCRLRIPQGTMLTSRQWIPPVVMPVLRVVTDILGIPEHETLPLRLWHNESIAPSIALQRGFVELGIVGDNGGLASKHCHKAIPDLRERRGSSKFLVADLMYRPGPFA